MVSFKKNDTRLIYEYIVKNAPQNMTMLDIGARTGKWLVPFVEAFPNATFHCFEALPEQFARLENRYKKQDNVNVYNTVISNQKNTVKFYRDLDRAGWSGLRKHSYIENFEEVELESTTVDNYNLNPYFIKIDVEGAELLALQGAIQTLKSTKIIYFECNEIHFKEYNYTANDLYDFLNDSGFDVYSVYDDKIGRDSFTYMTADERRYEDPKGYQSNFIARKS